MGNAVTKDISSARLDGKIIFVTGGNTGLGKRTIQNLAALSPMRIYLGARTASKAQAAIKDIQTAVPNACEIVHVPLDLTSFASIQSAASFFSARESRLDILMLNAGIMAVPFSLTQEGYEVQLGTNHVGHALLTKLLLPTLLATAALPEADVRVVVLSSMGHYMTVRNGLCFDTAALERESTMARYGASKLANILFARELALRYPQLTAVSLHPGVILTDLFTAVRANPLQRVGLWLYALLFPVLPGHYAGVEGGAQNQTWAAIAQKGDVVSGAYYTPVGQRSKGSKWARDEGLAKRLWEWTEAEFGKHGF
jgi:NAD(P)-dependent dehydrogenase (short-subunit alcohol dehydrogenase family)